MERRGKPRSRPSQSAALRLSYESADGQRTVVTAEVLETSSLGLGLMVNGYLPQGTLLRVRPSPSAQAALGELPDSLTVLWCLPAKNGMFRTGCSVGNPQSQRPPVEEPPKLASSGASGDEDLYELLQVHPKATPDTIHKVYRLMAQRYHPDNQETGSEDMFRKLLKAHQVLTDPERRAAYDVERSAARRGRYKLFERPEEATGPAAEKRKRQAVLDLLYRKRMSEPEKPELSGFEFEDLLDVPREHLAFALWYLREQGFVQRTDNNRFMITVKGVDMAEAATEAASAPVQEVRRLSAPVAR